jgi:hypothetical protein
MLNIFCARFAVVALTIFLQLEEYEQEENKQWMIMKKRLDHLVPLQRQRAAEADAAGDAQQAAEAAAQPMEDVEETAEAAAAGATAAAPTPAPAPAPIPSPEDQQFVEHQWNSTRVYRIIVDYLLRTGSYRAAEQLAQSAGCAALCDLALFQRMRTVSDALTTKHSCVEALEWCAENRSRLKKIKSNLEF